MKAPKLIASLPFFFKDTAPAEMYYDEEGAAKYHQNTRIREIQRTMSERCGVFFLAVDEKAHMGWIERAVQLMALPAGAQLHLLDIGCGEGFSSCVFSLLTQKNGDLFLLQRLGVEWRGFGGARTYLDWC